MIDKALSAAAKKGLASRWGAPRPPCGQIRVDADAALRVVPEIVEKYSKCQAKLAAWMEDSIPEGLTVFAFPAAVRQFLRTNNMEENLNRQIKQRTRLIPAFPNVSSLLRLVSAICAEISDDWETSSYRYMSTIKEL